MDTRDIYWFLDLNETLDVYGDRNDISLRPPRKLRDKSDQVRKGFANIPLEALAHVPGMDLTE